MKFIVTEVTTRVLYASDADEASEMARADMGAVVSQDVHAELIEE